MPASYNYRWSIFGAWKYWKVACLGFSDSDVCSEDELKRSADYLGIPVAQLRWVPSHGPEPISLLGRRMEALSLNPDEVAHIEPDTVQKLRQRCIGCKARGQCALDLANEFSDPGWQDWRDYCPNATTLMMLSTYQNYSNDPFLGRLPHKPLIGTQYAPTGTS
jgi:hypothetical protein